MASIAQTLDLRYRHVRQGRAVVSPPRPMPLTRRRAFPERNLDTGHADFDVNGVEVEGADRAVRIFLERLLTGRHGHSPPAPV